MTISPTSKPGAASPTSSLSSVPSSSLRGLLADLEWTAKRALKAPSTDFATYAALNLKIRTKAGSVLPFTMNRAQEYIHRRLEAQRLKTGRVRALILKSRQQGASTYIAGRFYKQCTTRTGFRSFILTHEDQATQNLFEMVQRYHEHSDPAIRPATSAENAKELYFSDIDSGYRVGTAGTKAVGRSSTIQLFHGSEAAFWPNAESHVAGVLQAVPDLAGTEVIAESTANGVGNWFHSKWRDSENGVGDFQAIFVPWFWSDEYRRAPGPEFHLDSEELEYAAQYGLDVQQMAWRRNKIAELKDESLFRQEYPATAAEAFQISGHDGLIRPELIVRARKANIDVSHGPLVIGFDPAWTGGDRHAMAWRCGRRVIKLEARTKLDTMQSAGWAKQVIDNDNPRRMFVDVGGVGAGVYDRLVEMGYGRIVRAINFGSAPLEPYMAAGGGPLNRRSEMWMKSRDWLEDPAGADIPDDDALQADACAPGYTYDSNTRLMLEKKADMRKRGVPSPDLWDAVALTFAETVPPAFEDKPGNDAYERASPRGGGSDWMAA